MRAIAWLTLACLLPATQAGAGDSRGVSPQPESNFPEIVANQNRSSAGELREGVLTVQLEARTGLWYPEEKDGPGLEVQAFAEPGRSLQIPGPLIRAPEGTEIHISVRNSIPGATLVVHGLCTRPANSDETLEIPPGATREVHFKAGAPGTYYYWATTTGTPFLKRIGVDSQLTGALIVDPPGVKLPDDRVFVIGLWADPGDPKANPPRPVRAVFVINGRSWPHTEQLTYTVGDTVHWRWINASIANHPMHLHGYFYVVEGKGDAGRDTIYADSEQHLENTELMLPGSTMSLTWFPTRPGNWLFHCHVIPHISPDRRLGKARAEAGAHDMSQHALEGMAGLVLGLHVLPVKGAQKPVRASVRPRKLRLIAEMLAGRYGKDPGFGYRLEEGSAEDPPGSASIPGPPLVLTQGQPVRITVVNRLSEPTSVHWHGIELESYYDGVAGWSGSAGHMPPPIPPGGSFVAEYTPPRAGTFIYHSHIDDVRQLGSGLYGAIVVLEPGQSFDPETDRVMMLGGGGPNLLAPVLLNGSTQPAPIELRAGVKYRFRFINIGPDDPLLRVSLLSGTAPVGWRAVGKDGAALPGAQATLRPARQVISVGETYDFEFEPTSTGEFRLEVFRPALLFLDRPEQRINVAVRVR